MVIPGELIAKCPYTLCTSSYGMRRETAAAAVILGHMILPAIVALGSNTDHAQYGGILMIGPIPIIFGASPQMALISIASALALMIISFLLLRSLARPSAPCWEEQKDWPGPGDLSREWLKDDDGKNRGIEVKGGAVVMIGPIPIILGSDTRTAQILMLVALVLMLMWFVFIHIH
jgi:uncharacterized protein (TIGR00304 family)